MSCSFSPAKRAPQNARRAVAAAVLDRKTRRLLCRRQCHRPCRHWSHWRPDDFRSFAYVVVSMFSPIGQSSFFRFFLWWVVSSVYRSVFAVLVIFFTVHQSPDVASLLQYPLPMASSTVCACRPSTTTNEVRTGDAMCRVRIVRNVHSSRWSAEKNKQQQPMLIWLHTRDAPGLHCVDSSRNVLLRLSYSIVQRLRSLFIRR